jgi:hypothetical protein
MSEYDGPHCGPSRRRKTVVSRRPLMPNAAEMPLLYALCFFPPASPTLALRAGKQNQPFSAHLNDLNYLRKSGAGEGIRTLDPNLGKVVLYP